MYPHSSFVQAQASAQLLAPLATLVPLWLFWAPLAALVLLRHLGAALVSHLSLLPAPWLPSPTLCWAAQPKPLQRRRPPGPCQDWQMQAQPNPNRRRLLKILVLTCALPWVLSACGTVPLPVPTCQPLPAELMKLPAPPVLLNPESDSATPGPTTPSTPSHAQQTARAWQP